MSMYSCNSACLLALNGQLSSLRASAGHRYFNANRFSLQMSLSLNSIAKLITRSVSLCHFVPLPESVSVYEPHAFW